MLDSILIENFGENIHELERAGDKETILLKLEKEIKKALYEILEDRRNFR